MNIKFDIPKNKSANVVRERKLKNAVFNRTRITVLVLTIILALSITGTLAYLTHTANQTPNRVVNGEIGLQIVENGAVQTTGTNSVSAGTTTKAVKLRSNNIEYRSAELVRVTFVPEITSASGTANTFFGETWSSPKFTYDSSGKVTESYIETDYLKLYLKSNWQENWEYKDGAFYYKHVLEKNTDTTEILQGVVWSNTEVAASDFGSVRVNVIADAIQSSPAEAASTWGATVNESTGVVTYS